MRLLSIVSAAAIASVAFAASSDDASAQRRNNNSQATMSVSVDYQRVLQESALGRDLATKIQSLRQQIGGEAQTLAPEQQSLEQERQRLATATRNQNADQIQSNPQVQQFQQRLQQFETRAQGLRGDLECSQMIAFRDFDHTVQPIIRTVMEGRGAGIVVNSASATYVSPEFDITTAVIQQLDGNQATRTANVARHAVAECQAQQAAAAPGQ